MKHQRGFTLVEGLLIVLIISVIGLAGYYVTSREGNEENANTSQSANSEARIDAEEETPEEKEAVEQVVVPSEDSTVEPQQLPTLEILGYDTYTTDCCGTNGYVVVRVVNNSDQPYIFNYQDVVLVDSDNNTYPAGNNFAPSPVNAQRYFDGEGKEAVIDDQTGNLNFGNVVPRSGDKLQFLGQEFPL